MTSKKVIRVLFVCLGNICRSPMAEAVFRSLVKQAGLEDQVDVESAGTGGWHTGERPHVGTLAILKEHNIDTGNKRARKLNRSDIQDFDYIVAMDSENVNDIHSMFGKRVPRLMDFAKSSMQKDVPDPYYTGAFDMVYQMVVSGSQGLLEHIRQKEEL